MHAAATIPCVPEGVLSHLHLEFAASSLVVDPRASSPWYAPDVAYVAHVLTVHHHHHRGTPSLELENDIEGVDDTWDVSQDGEKDVNPEGSTTSDLEENTEGWDEDGKDDLDNVAAREGHLGRS